MGVQLSVSLGGEASLGVGWSRQLEHGQVAGDIKARLVADGDLCWRGGAWPWL